MDISLDLKTLAAAYERGLRPTELVAAIYDRIAARGEDNVWIALAPKEQALARAAALEASGRSAQQPLWGIPFAVKDNIDVAGLSTTAACPDFLYMPDRSATVVEKLLAAGALLIGKTNLDQFATGLVGVRSPYGVARNPFNADYIPGGSSSGSAVSVGAGLVSFSLGTDTAGSGRVPAGFNNIVGLKPSVGLLSASGMLPACRALDCISIFALTVNDASAVLKAAAGYDASDAYSRSAPAGWHAMPSVMPGHFRFGVPQDSQLRFFGNAAAEELFRSAVGRMTALGGEKVEIDYAPFAEAAGLLYTPAGTAERTAALGDFLNSHADALHPVTRRIIEAGKQATGVDVHRHYYRVRELQQTSSATWNDIDVLLLPTSGTIYTVAELEADPVQLNSNLGYYTNFVNYFDLAALAVPNGFQPDGLPAGITLVGPHFSEPLLATIGDAYHRQGGLQLGATRHAQPATAAASGNASYPSVTIAVFGAHMSGLPLNYQLRDLGGRRLAECRTSPDYRLYVIAGALPRPGMVRTRQGGTAILGELWQVPTAGFGAFVAGIPAPLGIGDVTLEDGRVVKGFVCEASATADAPDITSLGGWRAWLETRQQSALAVSR
ncbi:allophanate hydrolase [Ferrovibrio sp.]|uniref:allophanate hydrolase n=1 Tax=Ferrovibrio sp. TaxID=1917215 RepID=UPI000CCB53D1|nr:allophanate hydrolase [Ferrovibrio sp.]PJI40942.1 MAG: allophanate hydrolase [Ferrovibrio sp.]